LQVEGILIGERMTENDNFFSDLLDIYQSLTQPPFVAPVVISGTSAATDEQPAGGR
jgi:hypothetical protein